uniref:Polyprotein n=1 Tax=Beihai conger calicivirus TaxID=2116161 RepID=A0A2P1GMH9_9CALI|nr:polyprotein [Beihai conger calicivirus]
MSLSKCETPDMTSASTDMVDASSLLSNLNGLIIDRKKRDWLAIASSIIEALKPTTLVNVLFRMTNNFSVADWICDLVILGELYAPILRDVWPVLKTAFMSLNTWVCQKIVENTSDSREPKDSKDPDEDRKSNIACGGAPTGTQQCPPGYTPRVFTPDEFAAMFEGRSTEDDFEDASTEFHANPGTWADVPETIVWMLKFAWSKTSAAFIAMGAAMMTACVTIGTIFPEAKTCKKAMDRMFAFFKGGKAVRDAANDSAIFYDAAKEAIENTLGEAEPPEWKMHVDFVRELSRNIDMHPQLVRHPAFPIMKLKESVAHLDKCAQKEKGAKWSYFNARADEGRALLNRLRKILDTRTPRPQPYVVLLAGQPGMGKTTFVNEIAAAVNQIFGTNGYDTFQCGEDHHDNLLGSPVLVMEEFGLHNKEEDLIALQRLADTSVVVLDNDLLENKGRKETPAIIIVVTNHEDIAKGSKFPDAIHRRIDLHLHVRCDRLIKWRGKPKNQGQQPSKAKLKELFRDGTQFSRLPVGAKDWRGNFVFGESSGWINPVPMSAGLITRNAVSEIKERWDAILKIETPACFYHSSDFPVIVFRGPPGTGKSRLAADIPDAVVIDDPWRDDETWKTTIGAIIGAEESEKLHIITTNWQPWEERMAKETGDVQGAVSRRLEFYDFDWNRKGWVYGKYTVADYHEAGWSRCVSVRHNGVMQSRLQIVETLKRRRPTPKRTTDCDVPTDSVAFPRLATTALTVGQLACAQNPALLIKSFNIIGGMSLSLLKQLGTIFKQVKFKNTIEFTPSSFVVNINDSRIKVEVAPCSVKFGDATLNFISVEGRLRVALVTTDTVTEKTLEDCQIRAPPMVDPQVSRLFVNLAMTVTGAVTSGLRLGEQFHSPTKDRSQYAAWSGRRTVSVAPRGYADEESWETKNDWLAEEEMDYGNIRLDQGSKDYIIPCTRADGSAAGWAFSHKTGILVNKHVLAETKKIGPKPLGDCRYMNIKHTDFTVVIPQGGNPYKKATMPFSTPKEGEFIQRHNFNGTVDPGRRVLKAVTVHDPSGHALRVFTVESDDSKPGDCGLPWFRVVGNSLELVGLHTGVRASKVMITPVSTQDVSWHSGNKNYTYIRKTQYHDIPQVPQDYRPSDKVWGEPPTAAEMTRRACEVFFKAPKTNRVCEEAVRGAVLLLESSFDMSERRSWSVAAAVRSLDQSTSAGPDYGTVKSEVFDQDGAPLEKYARQFYSGLRGLPDSSCLVSLKDELRPPNKVAAGATRPIFVFNVHSTVKVKQHVGSGMASLMTNAGTHPWSPGISFCGGGWAAMCKELSRFKYYLDADFGRWDSTVSHGLLDQAINVFSHLAPTERQAEVRAWLSAMGRANTQHGVTRTGLPSGVVGTAHVNCTVHVLVINDILIEANRAILGELGCPVVCFAYGDDIIVGMNDPGLAQTLIDGWARRGFNATNAAKTGPPCLTPLDKLSFLKRGLVQRDGEWYAPLDIKSIWRSIGFARHWTRYDHTDGVQTTELTGGRAVNAFQSFFSEMWQHGRGAYEEAKKILIEHSAKRAQRLPIVIPPYERFSPRDVLLDQNAGLGDTNVSILTVRFDVGGKENMATIQSNETVIEGAPAPGGEAVGTVLGMPGVSSGLAEMTAGIETAAGTTGGSSSTMDPAVRMRFVAVPGGALSIRTTTTVGTRLYLTRVDPGLNPFTAYLANMYNAWCGGFEIMVVVGANNFIGGKLLAVYTPPQRDPTGYSLDSLTAFPHAVLDIRLMDNVTMHCSDIKNVLWHPTADLTPQGSAGYFSVWLLTNIVTAGNAGVEMTLDIRLFARPSAEFDYQMLVPPVLGESGTSPDVALREMGHALSVPACGSGTGTVVDTLLVLSNATSTVSEEMWAGVVSMGGERILPYSVGSSCAVRATALPSGVADTYWLKFYTDNGDPWDIGEHGGSNTLPYDFLPRQAGSDANGQIFWWWANTGGPKQAVGTLGFGAVRNVKPKLTVSSGQKIDNLTGMLNWLPTGTLLVPNGRLAPVPTFTPNNGESLIAYASVSTSNFGILNLSTRAAANLRVTAPRELPVGTCAVYNMMDSTGTTTVQCKLYANGVMTTGGTKTAIIYASPVTFEFVSIVGTDYKLNSPTGGRDVETVELLRDLRQWLVCSQELGLALPLGASTASSNLEALLERQRLTNRPRSRANNLTNDSDSD